MSNVLVGADFSQIEARVLLWLFGEHVMLDKFRRKLDIYSDFGNEWLYPGLDPPISKENPDRAFERAVCKECVLGCGFGLGGEGFHRTLLRRGLVVELNFAKRAVAAYRASVPYVVTGWRALDLSIAECLQPEGKTHIIRGYHNLKIEPGLVTLPSGRKLRYDGVTCRKETRTWFDNGKEARTYEENVWFWRKQGRQLERLYGPKLTENIVQAIARDVMCEAIIFFRKVYEAKVPWMVPKLSVHDELIWVVPEGSEAVAKELIREGMTRTVAWAPDLPVDAEVKSGPSYYDLK